MGVCMLIVVPGNSAPRELSMTVPGWSIRSWRYS